MCWAHLLTNKFLIVAFLLHFTTLILHKTPNAHNIHFHNHLHANSLFTLKGYSTEDGANSTASRSGRPIGPLGSSRAGKNRRSQSAQGSSFKNQSLLRSNSAVSAHSSRQKFRTPAKGRLQTMSADRGTMNPVTPKIQMNTPVALLRYPHVGETVMSMSGSPVIVQGYGFKEVLILFICY